MFALVNAQWPIYWLIVPCALMGVLWHEYDAQHRIFEIMWSFSIWLEAVAILPQVAVMQADGQCENINSHYVFSLGSYRAFYIINWIYRKFTDGCAAASHPAIQPPIAASFQPQRCLSSSRASLWLNSCVATRGMADTGTRSLSSVVCSRLLSTATSSTTTSPRSRRCVCCAVPLAVHSRVAELQLSGPAWLADTDGLCCCGLSLQGGLSEPVKVQVDAGVV